MALMTDEAGTVHIAVAPELQAHPKRWLFLAILFLVGTSSATDRVVISVLLESIKHEFHVSDTMLGAAQRVILCVVLFRSGSARRAPGRSR